MRGGRPGVYAIVNRVTGKRYVGQTKYLVKRIAQHFYELRKGTHCCRRLQRSFAKHGRDAFLAITMEVCSVEQLNEIEQKYLDVGFDAGDLYNSAKVAEAPARGIKHSKERCEQASRYRKELFSDPAYRRAHAERIRAGMTPEVRARQRGREFSTEHRANISLAQQARFADPKGREELRIAQQKRSPEWRAQIIERGRSWRSRPEWVAKHNAAIALRSENPAWQAENAERLRSPKMRASVRAFWDGLKADPAAYAAFIVKRSAGRRKKLA